MGKQRTPQGSRRRPPVRRTPSAPAPTVNGAAPEPDVQDLAEDQAETTEALTEATASEAAETTESLLESVSPIAIEAASAAEPGASEPAPRDEAPAHEAAPEPAAHEAVEPEPAPAAEAAPVEEPAPALVAVAESPAAEIDAAPEPEAPAPAAPAAPAPRVAPRFALKAGFTPTYVDVEGIGTILMNYVQNESAAALSHMRALGEVRTPADMIRLNVTEMQRAADASLTCWIAIARRASRSMSAH